jgi:hypothetical protein
LAEGRDGLGENCCDGSCDEMHDGWRVQEVMSTEVVNIV